MLFSNDETTECMTHFLRKLLPEKRKQGGRTNFLSITVLLVSTYVVCERLSVMHEPAGVVENLVQILQNTPIL